jgi:hypothetical protein
VTIDDTSRADWIARPALTAVGCLRTQERLHLPQGTIQGTSAPSRSTKIGNVERCVPAEMPANVRNEVVHRSDLV